MNPKQKIIFEDIPKNYELMKNQIIDKKIKMIYSKFIFKYLDLNKLTENVTEIESQLLDYFKDVKFITYHSNTIKQNNDESNFKLSKEKNNTIICIEDECLIIEGEISIITEIIQKMQETKSIINLTFSYEKEDIKEEIDSFISHYQSETKNEFFRMTIKSICGFLIRRFFYPTEYFKNPLFFVFNQPNKLKEKTLKSKLTKEIFSSRNDKTKIDLMKTINEIKFLNFNHCEINDKKFNKNDFIVLRALFSSGRATFYLVIHIETLYLFVMKIFSEFEQDSIEFQREEKFCEQFSHRCFVQFYGFLKEGNKRIGFIYEFMSNNSLNFLFKSTSKNKFDQIFNITIINRLFQGIEYLQTKSLIHGDLKPSNILFDHDFIPYISDFESIFLPDDKISNFLKPSNFHIPLILQTKYIRKMERERNESLINKISKPSNVLYNNKYLPYNTLKSQFNHLNKTKVTDNENDILTLLYSSPEQSNNENVSFPTDIFSFGLIIYFLFEKKNMRSSIEQTEILPLTKSSDNLQKLYQLCTKISPIERLNINEIKTIINVETNSFYYIDKFFLEKSVYFDKWKIADFFYESIILNHNYNTFNILILQHIINGQEDYSKIYTEFGLIYLNGIGNFNKDYQKAIDFFEISSQLNNSDALFNLGCIYFYGKCAKKDYNKALKYFDKSSKLNNSDALLYLGTIYLEGYIVTKDYLKSIFYFEKSAKLNNSLALFNLGIIYFNGYGIEKDYKKAHQYFESSSKLNNSNAFYCLGIMHLFGFGVNKNIKEAIKYIEFSSRYNNSRAYLYLGFIYFSRFKNDFITGKKFFEFSSQLNNLEADFFLGYIYSNETFFDEDIKKAIQYYSKCIESKKIIIKDLNSEIVEGYNNYYYHSHNDLGLIYIIYFNDIQNGTKHIKESAFGEYPYGQNNFGLLCELYLNQIENAIYMYEKASKNHFALSEFNLGFLL